MMDLQPDRSLIRRLLERGLDVYLIDWGYPDGADRYTDLDDYINGYLHRCLDVVLRAHAIAVDHAAGRVPGRHLQPVLRRAPSRARAQPHHDGHAGRLPDARQPAVALGAGHRRRRAGGRARRGARATCSMPPTSRCCRSGCCSRSTSTCSMPASDQAQMDNFMRMEKWIFDSPAQAGAAFAQFTRWFFQENRLLRGTLEIGGRRVDLKQHHAAGAERLRQAGSPGAAGGLDGARGPGRHQRLHGPRARRRPHRHVRQRPLAARAARGDHLLVKQTKGRPS